MARKPQKIRTSRPLHLKLWNVMWCNCELPLWRGCDCRCLEILPSWAVCSQPRPLCEVGWTVTRCRMSKPCRILFSMNSRCHKRLGLLSKRSRNCWVKTLINIDLSKFWKARRSWGTRQLVCHRISPPESPKSLQSTSTTKLSPSKGSRGGEKQPPWSFHRCGILLGHNFLRNPELLRGKKLSIRP